MSESIVETNLVVEIVEVATGIPGAPGAAGADGAPGAAGANGAPGADGLDGSSVFNYLGAWDSGPTYNENDVVNFQGSGYVCIQNGSIGNPPSVNPTIWQLMAAKGDQGVQGDPGADGAGSPPGGTTGQILSKISDDDFDVDWVDPPVSTGTANRISRFNSAGDLSAIDQLQIDDNGYVNAVHEIVPSANSGSFDTLRFNVNIRPDANSPAETWQLFQNFIQFDPDNSGFDFGTGGSAFRFHINTFNHNGTGNIGTIEFIQNNFSLGNGTDPIEIQGIGYAFGLGQINDNVLVKGPIQGYGFQLNVADGVTYEDDAYMIAFYDSANIACELPGYTSMGLSPNIFAIKNNHNFNGLSINAFVDEFHGNSSYFGIVIGGNLGTFDTGGYNGLNINPNIDSVNFAQGIFVSMDSVTVSPGDFAELVIQDLTITCDVASAFANNYSIEFENSTTAGNEVASILGQAIKVTIESGVSTATQVAAALNAQIGFTTNFSVAITGTASDPQVTQAATNLSGGVDPGSKKAAYLDGDVEITGSLTFGGSLAIGALNAFASQALVNGGGNPASIHSLVTMPTVAANTTVANADTLGVNTAMLLDIGDNSVVTTSFVGLSALALPAVAKIGANASIDQVAGATFALSLDGTSGAGGVMTNVDLCRSIAIPNGITTITNLRGFKFDLPFGDPGTNTWGFYEAPGAHNFFAGDLKIGGADIVANASVALEIESTTKAFLNARMTTTERDALTAVNGMQIYNLTTDKLQVRAAGAWVDLH